MAPEKQVPSEAQEQSIKSRKHQLYDAEPKLEAAADRVKVRSVDDYLRETPAAPLPAGLKASLWGGGALVALLLVTVLIIGERRAKPTLAASTSTSRTLASNPAALQPKGSGGSSGSDRTSVSKREPSSAPEPQKEEKKPKKKNSSKKKKKNDEAVKKAPPKVPDNAAWGVSADTSSQSLEIPANLDLTIPIPGAGGNSVKVIFPTTPSPFVVVGDNRREDSAREVWDLRTKKRTGVLRGQFTIQQPVAVSPDGVYIASSSVNEKGGKDKKTRETSITVWSFKTGKEVKSINAKSTEVGYVDFLGEDQIITATPDGQWFQVWNYDSGEAVGEAFGAPGTIDLASLALSPGRKFLAMTNVADGKMWVYDVAAGTPAGTAVLPSDAAGSICTGLNFSPDGAEIAGLFDSGGHLRILCWDAATGKQAADHKLDERYGIQRFPNDQGRALEWMAARGGWLVYDQALIDRQSGKRIWSLPVYYPDLPPTPRRLVSGDRAVLLWGQGRSQVLRLATIPKDKLATAREKVRAGGSAVDAVLPPTRSADWAGLHPVPTGGTAWSVTPDPGVAPSKALSTRPIVLKNRLDEIAQIFCSGGETGQAAVAVRSLDRNDVNGDPLFAGFSAAIERYDLLNGKRTSRSEIPAVCNLMAFSPDAGRIMLRDAESHERIDVYSATDMKHLAAWRPYEKETGIDRMVLWAAFIDPQRALTINPAGKLVLWIVAEGRAYYQVKEAFQGIPVLSPGRKVVAGFAGGNIRFLETASGKRLGEVPAPSSDDGGRPGLIAGAFRFDGKELAVLLNGGQLARVDVASGKVTSEFRSPVPNALAIEWCGPRHWLINNTSLVDIEKQWEVWRYSGNLAAIGSPDGRHWAAVEPFASEPAYLAGFILPEKGIDKIVKAVAEKKTPALLRAGSPVALRLEFENTPKNFDATKREIYEFYAGQLRANDVPIDDGAPVTLSVKIVETSTGDKPELGLLMPTIKDKDLAKKEVPIRYLDVDVALVDSTGRISLEPKRTITFKDLGLPTIPANSKNPGEYLRGLLWKIAQEHVMMIVVPPYVSRSPEGGVIKFPGYTNLAQLLKK